MTPGRCRGAERSGGSRVGTLIHRSAVVQKRGGGARVRRKIKGEPRVGGERGATGGKDSTPRLGKEGQTACRTLVGNDVIRFTNHFMVWDVVGAAGHRMLENTDPSSRVPLISRGKV